MVILEVKNLNSDLTVAASCLVKVSIAVIKHQDQKHPGEGRDYFRLQFQLAVNH